MCQILIKIPDVVLHDTHMGASGAAEFARRTVAMDYYTQNNVSIGYYTQIVGTAEEDFIKYSGQDQTSIFRFGSKKEFMEELTNT